MIWMRKPFGNDLELDLVLEFVQLRIFIDLALQFLQQQFQPFLLDLLGHAFGLFVTDGHFIRLRLGFDLGIERVLRCQGRRTTQVDDVGRAAFGKADRVLEVTGDGDLLLRRGVDSSHSTRKNAIIAVAKSAKAIFQAPP